MPLSSKPSIGLDIDHIEDFGDPLGWQRIRSIQKHPEFDRVSREIHTEAYERGKAEESKRSQAALEALRVGFLDRLEQLLENLAGERRRFHEENSEELLKLSLAIGEKVAHATLLGNTEALKAKLDSCLDRLGTASSYGIHVNDGELDLLTGLMEMSGRNHEQDATYRLVADPRLEPGDLVLEAEEGRIESICAEELGRLGEFLIQMGRESQGDDEHLPE